MAKLKSANHIQWQCLLYCIVHKNTAKYSRSDVIYAAYQRQLDNAVHCHTWCLQFTLRKALCSSFLVSMFRFPAVRSPQTEETRSTCLRSWSREQILRQWSKERIFRSSCCTRPELQTNIVLEGLAVSMECEQLTLQWFIVILLVSK